MNVRVSFTIDNPHDATIQVDKFFQVIFVDKLSTDQARSVSIYTALAVRSSKWTNGYPLVKCNIKVDGQEPDTVEDVATEFYNNVEVLRQFWGKESILFERTEDLIRHIRKEIPVGNANISNEIGELIPLYLREVYHSIVIKETEKGIDPLIIVPQDLETNIEQSLFWTVGSIPITLADYTACGLWAKSNYIIKSDGERGVIPIEHTVFWEENIRCNDFSLYYVLPSSCELQGQSKHYVKTKNASSSGKNNRDEIPTELFAITNQPSNKYFPQWEELDIRQSLLLKFNNNAPITAAFMQGTAEEVQLQFRVIDTQVTARREARAIFTSIWIAALVALGMDSTRSAQQSWLFPLPAYTTPELWWILMCLSLIPVFITPVRPIYPRMARIFGNITVLLFAICTICAFFIRRDLQESMFLSIWFWFTVISIIIGGLFTFLCSRGLPRYTK